MALCLMVEGPKSSMHPINVATKYGNSELVQMLLDSGHTATKQDSDYNNPIHGAAKFGHLEVYKLLMIEYGIKNHKFKKVCLSILEINSSMYWV